MTARTATPFVFAAGSWQLLFLQRFTTRKFIFHPTSAFSMPRFAAHHPVWFIYNNACVKVDGQGPFTGLRHCWKRPPFDNSLNSHDDSERFMQATLHH